MQNPIVKARFMIGIWYEKIYYLDEGEYNFVIDIYSSAEDVNIYSEYLGEEITGITFDYDQLLDYDFDWHRDNDEYTFDSVADATIAFSSGKTFAYTDGTLTGTLDSEYADGINNIQIEFFDSFIPSTATVYPASHYIADVELSNVDYYLENSIEYYDDCAGIYPYGETITVTFTDGSTQQFEYNRYGNHYVTLSNGQQYRIYIDYYLASPFDKNKCRMKISVGYITLKEYCFTGKKASFPENLKVLFEKSKYIFEESAELFKFSFTNLDLSDLSNTVEDSLNAVANAALNLLNIQAYVTELILYYLF